MRQFLKEILSLPYSALLGTRLTKKFFYKNFDLTTKEKKLIDQGVSEMELFASVTEKSTNITPVINEEKTYENIFIVSINVHKSRLDQRKFIADAVQKYFPYHSLIFIHDEETFQVSAALKRINRNDSSKRVIEQEVKTPELSLLYKNELQQHFYEQIEFKQVDKTNLETLYKGYFSALVNFRSSYLTNQIIKRSRTRTEEDLELLKKIDELNLELAHINQQISKAHQTNEEVALHTNRYNVKQNIKELKAQLTN